ncbi:hypothetical protein BBJ28_00006646 [Nothophytophthora sp. Chile5]|nr:hypothetical protein BBJ28_00006646 [Nothophytophthora sp. Chile5]
MAEEAAIQTPVELMGDHVDEVREAREQAAAACLQRLFRCRRARSRLRALLASVFEKFYDAESGLYYYLDKRSGETTWEKPRVLRGDDDIELAAVYEGGQGRRTTSTGDETDGLEIVDLEQNTEDDEAKPPDFSAQELALVREQFAHYDADSSGSISATELHKLFSSLGEPLTLSNVRELIQEVDADGNGEVDFDEFLQLLRKQQHKNRYSASLTLALLFGPRELNKLKQQFMALDLDGSGAIDEHELQKLVEKLGRHASDFDLPAMLREVDADGSGSIGFNEFLQVVAAMTKGEDGGTKPAFAALLALGIAQGLLNGLDEVVQASRQKVFEWFNADLIAEQKRLAVKRERRRRQEEERQRQLTRDRELYAQHQIELAAIERARHAQVEGLAMEVEFEGDGRNFPTAGQFARVHYVGSFQQTGEVFESTRARCGSALELCVGAGHTIAGFDLALQRMSVGETTRVTIAPALGYGVKGRPPRIPPNAALVFRIELISIKEKLQLSRDVAISRAATLPLSYITQRKAFAFLMPKSMVKRRRRRRVEVEKEVANIFEVQMRVRMRRQSVKQVELRVPRSVDDYSATLDLRESSENVDGGRSNAANGAQRSRVGKRSDVQPRRWVPYPIEEGVPSPLSSVGSEVPLMDAVEGIKDEDGRPTEYIVTRVRQRLARDAMFRLEQLGDFDMTKSVPSYSYRDSSERVNKHWSVDTTEGSLGVYRLPRLLHNSRVNLPPRPPQYYM